MTSNGESGARWVSILALLGCLGASACSGGEGAPDVPDPGAFDPGTFDPGTADPGSVDPGVDPGPTDPGPADVPPFDTAGIQCVGRAISFPAFDKTCAGDGDCALVFHTVNCCGSEAALGIRADQVPAFEVAEAVCDQQWPACDCPTQAIVAEDGKTALTRDAFAAGCVEGTCRSRVGPSCADLASSYFTAAAALAWCTGPDQCAYAPSGLCVGGQGCGGILANQDADWTAAQAILGESKAQGCPAVDATCECPKPVDGSFGCHAGRCVACDLACPAGCPCQRDYLGCPTGNCDPDGCEAVEAQVTAKVAQADACSTNAGCTLRELGAICGSMSCRQVSVAADAPAGVLAALSDLGGQGLQLGCSGYHCGCGPLGSPVCIDGHCRLCPPDCGGSCEGLVRALQELAMASRTCWGAGECVVPDVCTTCGVAVRRWAVDQGLATMGAAAGAACGPCDGWCRALPRPYKAACVAGTCERLSFGEECQAVHDQFDALVASPGSLACQADGDCVPTSFMSQPFCTTACACAVVTNKTAAHWAGILASEYQSLGCPSEPCACTKCMSVARCIEGRCQ